MYIDGPFGAPASNIFRAHHAVLVGTGIGVTPFSSILQSIMRRYWEKKQSCPNCNHRWTEDLSNLGSLKKVLKFSEILLYFCSYSFKYNFL